MTDIIETLVGMLIVVSWLAGIVIAKGAISITLAVICPPYAWYLIVEKLMVMNGVM